MDTYVNQANQQQNQPQNQHSTYSQPQQPYAQPDARPASLSQPQSAPKPTFRAETISHKAADHDIDSELQELINKNQTRIKVIGCGGGGNNTINRIAEVGVKGIQTIAINTDAQDLLYTTCDKKLLIGKELTQG
ncbi:MAG: hypothetical protein KJ896_01805, partial [Nanoarchaeota archaeon]|nr:hypothetical protein [Nanoarchaeota archaeon]